MKNRQHFIPRAILLRNFSNTHFCDDQDNLLSSFDKETRKSHINTVQNLGFENLLYEGAGIEQNAVENLLSSLETDLLPELTKIINVCKNACDQTYILHGKNEKDNLKLFLTLQYFRTPKIKSIYDCNDRDRETAFLGGLIGSKDGVWWPKRNVDSLSSHFFVFERNETETPFLISDHPVSTMKATADEDAINFRLPLTPNLHVLLIDPRSKDSNSLREWRNRLRIIRTGNDIVVDSWNQHSIHDARRFVYFSLGYELLETDISFRLRPIGTNLSLSDKNK